MLMTNHKKNPIYKLTPKLINDICEMFDDGVPYQEIAEWFGLSKVTVKEVLVQVFPTDIYGILIPHHQGKNGRVIVPKLTEPDIFACQLALLVSIGDSAINDFFEKVRESYPTVTLAVENPKGSSFYRSPEIEIDEEEWFDDDRDNHRMPYVSSVLYSYRLY